MQGDYTSSESVRLYMLAHLVKSLPTTLSASQNEHSGINAKTWKMVVTPPPCRLISIGVLKLLNITYLQGR